MASVDDLVGVLRGKVGYETVQRYVDDDQIVLMGRMRGGAEDLLIVGHQLQVHALGRDWTHEIAKVFVLKGRKLVHAWRLVFEGQGVQERIPEFIAVIGGCPRAKRNEVTSIELPGGNRYRDYTSGKLGKGAAPMGQAHVGPAAFLAALTGQARR